MYNYDILTRLQNGATADELAAEFTDALNHALKLQEEKEAARKAKEQAAAEKEADTKELLETFNAYFKKHYPDSYCGETSIDEHLIDVFIAVFDSFARPEKTLSKFFTW